MKARTTTSMARDAACVALAVTTSRESAAETRRPQPRPPTERTHIVSIKTFVGRCGSDPELRVTRGGKSFVTFSVAETKRRFNKEANEWEDAWTIWHDVEAFQNADAIAGISKGTLVVVVGEERDGTYENRDGVKVRKVVVTASTVGTVVRDASGGGQQATTASWSGQQASEEPWGTPGSAAPAGGDSWTTPATSSYSNDTGSVPF